MQFSKITRHLFPETLNGKKYKAGGIKVKLVKHLKDYNHTYDQLGGLFGVGYKPKHTDMEIETYDVKDQNGYNTCSFNAYTLIRQMTEGKILSPRSIVAYARQKGLLSGNGFSTLENNSLAGKQFGVAEDSILTNDLCAGNWERYSDPTLLTTAVKDNAITHRPDSSKKFYVRTKEEYIKALDDGYGIEIGIPWYSGYNMGGGFTAPWKIQWGKGVYVGGHAIVVKGYKETSLDTNGNLLDCSLKIQNSYSKSWGFNGDFFSELSDLITNGIVGMVEVDLDENSISQLIKNYEGKQVKGSKPGIYLIENGIKRAFPDAETFFAYGGRYGKYGKSYVDINQSTLDSIPEGSPIKITDSPYWTQLQTKGITVDFLDQNRDLANVWSENPKTLQAIVKAMNDLLPPIATSTKKNFNLIEFIKSLFNL